MPASGPAGTVDPGAEPPVDAGLWRLVDLFRLAALAYAGVLLWITRDGYRRPAAAWAVLAVLACWSVFLLVRRARPVPVLVVDLSFGVAGVLATRWVDDPARISAGAHTLPAIWPAAAVLSWAIRGGWRGGVAAAAVISVADVVEVGGISSETLNNIVLLLLTGIVVGYGVQLIAAGRRELAAAVAVRSAGAERERLARDIHDSVLQVLSFVQRRGAELGGEAADLGAMAGEQEARLRALVATARAAGSTEGGPDPGQDLRAELGRFAGAAVTVSGPAHPVRLPGRTSRALVQATAAALDNVRRHAGPGARAWILLEHEGDLVTLTVRDDGTGFEPGRPEVARRAGRLGLSSAIRGRIEEVGGKVLVTSEPGQGTEIEMRVPA